MQQLLTTGNHSEVVLHRYNNTLFNMANKSLTIVIAIAVIVTVCSAITDEQKRKAEGYVKTCIGKIGVSKDDVSKVIAGDFSVTGEKIECFAKCFFEQAGFMDADGEFIDANAIEKLSTMADRAKVEALVNTCKLKMGSNPCETAYKIYQCYVKHNAL